MFNILKPLWGHPDRSWSSILSLLAPPPPSTHTHKHTHTSPPRRIPPKFNSPFLHCVIRRRLRVRISYWWHINENSLGSPRVSMKSCWISLGVIPLLQRYFMTTLISTFSLLLVWHTLLLFIPISYCNQKSYSPYQRPAIRLNYQLIGILYQFIESRYIWPKTFWLYTTQNKLKVNNLNNNNTMRK